MFSPLGFDTHYLVLLLLLLLTVRVCVYSFSESCFLDFWAVPRHFSLFSTCVSVSWHFLIHFIKNDFSKRRSLTPANPSFSLFWAHFCYYEHISWLLNIIVTHNDISDMPAIHAHIFHTIPHIFHLQTTIPYTTNH